MSPPSRTSLPLIAHVFGLPNDIWCFLQTCHQILAHESETRSVVSGSLRLHGLYSPENSPGQNTGVGSLSLLQGISPTQGSNPGLLLCRQILYQLNHKGSPQILEWVAYPFSSGSSWPRNWTRVSCIAGGFFTKWAIGKAHSCPCRSAKQLRDPGAHITVLCWPFPTEIWKTTGR